MMDEQDKSLPALSLVLTCYNLSNYIEEALKSVFQQDYKGAMELIIVDDASEDNSVEIIQECIKKYSEGWDVTLLINKTNLGVSGATDRGWQKAKYDWIVEIDGDDVQYKDRCSHTAEIIKKHPKAAMVVLSHSCINYAGEDTKYRRYMISNKLQNEYVAESAEERANIYNKTADAFPVKRGAYGCSMCLNKSVVSKWGVLFSEGEKRFAQDPPWELRCFLSGPIVWSNELACRYRSHFSNILNRVRKYENLSDWIKWEQNSNAYAYKEFLAIEQMIVDVRRASKTPEMTDWTTEQLQQCLAMLEKYGLVAKLKHEWWSYNILKRVLYAFLYGKKVPREYSRWFLNRILPLKWSMWLKMNMK